MGYYSFYKIIKDIFRTIFGNKFLKILFICFLIFFILFLYKNTCNADNSIILTSFKNKTFTLPSFDTLLKDNPDYPVSLIVQRANSSNDVYLILTKGVPYLTNNSSSEIGYMLAFSNYGYVYKLTNNNWVLNNPWGDPVGLMPRDIIGSSIDLKLDNSDTTIFSANINTFSAPSFDNVSEIKQGNPDGVFISPNDLTENDNLYFHLLRIDNTIPNSDTSVYYYSDNTFLLNKDSEYYRTWLDPSNEGFYYYIPRYNLKLSTNSSYLYVLNNSPQQIQNSFGLYSVDISNGIYDVVQSDTTGVISATEEQTDIFKNMEEQSVENANSLNDINNTLNDTNVSSDTETNIEDSLNFNNKNEGLNNLNNGFFTRLTSMLSNLLGYNLADDTSVSIPFPNSDKHLILHSKDIYDNVTGAIRVIINAYWTFIFTFYLWKFINKIYISVSSGNILDSFSSSGEAITNDML